MEGIKATGEALFFIPDWVKLNKNREDDNV